MSIAEVAAQGVNSARKRCGRSYLPGKVLVGFVALSLLLPLLAHPRSRRPLPPPDPNYASALAAANRFLQAWQSQNPEDGLLLLTDAAKREVSEEKFQEFFEHGSSAAYEIARGRTLSDGRYSFPVVLFAGGEAGASRARPRFSHLIVARTTQNEWVVDRLP